jgi:hypothetical protein
MNHEHKFFIFDVRSNYELFNPPLKWIEEYSDALLDLYGELDQLYKKTEYAVLGCNCGEVIKQKIKREEDQTSE